MRISLYKTQFKPLTKAIKSIGGRAILVGGAVRDIFLESTHPPKDFDIEVFGVRSISSVKKALQSLGAVSEVGASFGVLKLVYGPHELDISLPRQDNVVGVGHRGFEVDIMPEVTFEAAASRRDFTCNAIGIDLQTGVVLDPFEGIAAIKSKRLCHVGPKFSEDPLRVYRAIQFCARFEFELHPDTLKLCRGISLVSLSKERCFDEWIKLLCLSKRPSVGLKLMDILGVLNYYPELKALQGVPQDPRVHPEGDVWQHTLMVVDEMAQNDSVPMQDKPPLMLAALCHDFGKPLCTQLKDRRYSALGHELKGLAPTVTFLKRLTQHKALILLVKTLVKEQHLPDILYADHLLNKVTDPAIRRLVNRVNIFQLLALAKADYFGRAMPEATIRSYPAGDWLHARILEMGLTNGPIPAFVKGKDVIALGLLPGPDVGFWVKKIYELQLDGRFVDRSSALIYLARCLN